MKCDLCNRRAKRLLCDPCAEMIARLSAAHARIHKTEIPIGQKLDMRAKAEEDARRESEAIRQMLLLPEQK